MKKSVKMAGIALLAFLVLCACVWRLRPHSFADLISADESTISSLACTATILGISHEGTPFIDNYALQALPDDSQDFIAVIHILNQSAYRQSFQNLLPRAVTSVRSNGISRKADLFLTWGNTEAETRFLTVLDDGKVVVRSGKNDRLFVYHAADRSMPDQLVNYVREHGSKNGSTVNATG